MHLLWKENKTMIKGINFKVKKEFIQDFKEVIKSIPSFRFLTNPTLKEDSYYLIDYSVKTNSDNLKVNEFFNKIYELEQSKILPKKKWYQRLFS